MHERMWNRDFILLIASNFLMYITYYAVLSALPVYLVSYLHATKSQVGVVVGAYTIASVLVRPFSGFTLDRFGRRTIFLLALVIYSFLFLHCIDSYAEICTRAYLGFYHRFGINYSSRSYPQVKEG